MFNSSGHKNIFTTFISLLIVGQCMATNPFKFPKEKKTSKQYKEENLFNNFNYPKNYNKVYSQLYQPTIQLKRIQGYMKVLYSIKNFGISNRRELRHHQNLLLKVQGRINVFTKVYSINVNAKFKYKKDNKLFVKKF